MAKRKHTQAFDRLLQEIVTFINQQSSQFMRWLLRSFIIMQRWQKQNAGFVLPTTVFMLMVVFLVVTALMFRTFNRTEQLIRVSQQAEINNAATPAIDRAKAKLEYLFTSDQLPGDPPPDEKLVERQLLKDELYTLPGEERVTELAVDIDGTTTGANVWKFATDTNGNGASFTDPQDLTTIYAIVSRVERGSVSVDPDSDNFTEDDDLKAQNLLVRNGPLAVAGTLGVNCPVPIGGNPRGWFEGSSTAFIYKNFQVYAITVPNAVIQGSATSNTAISTLQYQQDRAYEKANKFGAWFRYDLEIAPGPRLNWNGAMHSQGNIFLRGFDGLRSFLISSPNSCFFEPSTNSLITVRKSPDPGGQVVYGVIRDQPGLNGNNVVIDTYATDPQQIALITNNSTTNSLQSPDSIDRASGTIAISTDPVKLHTEGISEAREVSGNSTWLADGNFWSGGSPLTAGQDPRIKQNDSCAPYVDDTYRADNVFGPKPSYSKETKDEETQTCEAPAEGTIGQAITTASTSADRLAELTRDEPLTPDSAETVGLDGYWERRARFNGLRLIVGQRLELGNLFGWKEDSTNPENSDPLYPPSDRHAVLGSTRANEGRQLTTLRDNLSAVQATAVYHHSYEDGYFPIAYVASTVHPGTTSTLNNSATFKKPINDFDTSSSSPFGSSFGENNNAGNNTELLINFFKGEGTNGWEFNTYDADDFDGEIANGRPLGKALRNLANFAGDPDGAFPLQQGSRVRPDPHLTMWGNFSNLRKIFNSATVNYNSLSLADKTTLQTAAGTLGMLAYNISYLQAYEGSSDENALNTALEAAASLSDPPDTPDKAIAYLVETGADEEIIELAWIIHLKEQVKRDQIHGFNQNPATPGTNDYTCTYDNSQPGLQLLCAKEPKFPSLHYLFPITNHAHDDGSGSEYVTETESLVSYTYQAITDAEIARDIALQPRPLNDWQLPSDPDSDTDCDTAVDLHFHSQRNYINYSDNGQSCIRVPFKDAALFDGREMISTRLLNLDIDLMRRNEVGTSNDTWLPSSGLLYAFREDAVREDGIARPSGSTMNVWGNNPTDPAFINNISPKPVDYYPDPDRRPYGFRLKNGIDLRRFDGNSVDEENPQGISFISDNPVYIQGDFNVHSTNGSINDANRLEEFTGGDRIQGLSEANYRGRFYDRSEANLDTRFARPEEDTWRPTEIIADAVNIISSDYCDGSIQSGIRQEDIGFQINGGTEDECPRPSSYRNSHLWSNLTTAEARRWICSANLLDPMRIEDPNGSGCYWPIQVSRNGEIQYDSDSVDDTVTATNPVIGDYRTFADSRTSFNGAANTGNPTNGARVAPETWVNAVIVSGIIPSRVNQSNGGLHNFPRMHETWRGVDLNMYGSFIQLNFSNYATGPWDQDAWEPGSNPVAGNNPGERFRYYWPPERRWGYDVGLQYAPAGPVSSRMLTPGLQRDESYKEPSASDPYICRLRSAIDYPCQ